MTFTITTNIFTVILLVIWFMGMFWLFLEYCRSTSGDYSLAGFFTFIFGTVWTLLFSTIYFAWRFFIG